MRALLLALALAAGGCVDASYARLSGELDATRDENARLRDENAELHRIVARTTTKLDMIDRIIHEDGGDRR